MKPILLAFSSALLLLLSASFAPPQQCQAQVKVRNGLGRNALKLSTGALPILGQDWSVQVDCSGHKPSLYLLQARSAPLEGLTTDPGEILIDVFGGIVLYNVLTSHGGGLETYDFGELPDDPALCGLPAYFQAFILGKPGVELTNALDIVLGS